jgi:hypothetical protein
MSDPLARLCSEPNNEAALELAIGEIRDIVWAPKISMSMLRRRVALVLAPVSNLR